jgi:hypothetical protein
MAGIGEEEANILPFTADKPVAGLQTTTTPCECTWRCWDVPSSRSSPYHGRCLRRDYPRNDGFKSGKSLSTGPSESPAPGSRLQESGGKDDDLSWWSWLKKKKGRRNRRAQQETLEGLRMRNLLRAGRGLFRSELWRSAAAKLDSQHAASTTEHPQTTTAFSPATYRLPRHTTTLCYPRYTPATFNTQSLPRYPSPRIPNRQPSLGSLYASRTHLVRSLA